MVKCAQGLKDMKLHSFGKRERIRRKKEFADIYQRGNRIKRLLREFFRLNKERLSPSRDMVVIAKKSLQLPLTYSDVERELAALLIR